MNFTLALAGLGVGIIVGLTGMGGGALMTPILVLVFGIPPVAAVSSDLAASAVMKPFGGFVHARRGTVNWQLVRWLCVGSVPSAFCGVLLLRLLGSDASVQHTIQIALGVALVLAAAGLVLKSWAARRRGDTGSAEPIVVRDLVGTDLVQAIPLVFSAAFGHALFGDLKLDLAASVLIGSVPGVLIGSRISSRAPAGLIRSALVIVLLASALKLFNLSTVVVAVVAGAGVLIAIGAGLSRRASASPAREGERETASVS
jgi:uncharacterized membrane protein YfcA